MQRKASIRKENFRAGSLKAVGSAHSVLLQMAKDAELLKERAERIRALRRMARVSQETAAQNIGVSVRGYAEWEAARGGINDDNLKALARYFGTTPDYIEYGVMKHATPDPFVGDGSDPLAEILELLRRLDERLTDAETERSNAIAAQLERFAVVLQRIDDMQAAIEQIAARRRRTA